jgi:hypothetical protein
MLSLRGFLVSLLVLLTAANLYSYPAKGLWFVGLTVAVLLNGLLPARWRWPAVIPLTIAFVWFSYGDTMLFARGVLPWTLVLVYQILQAPSQRDRQRSTDLQRLASELRESQKRWSAVSTGERPAGVKRILADVALGDVELSYVRSYSDSKTAWIFVADGSLSAPSEAAVLLFPFKAKRRIVLRPNLLVGEGKDASRKKPSEAFPIAGEKELSRLYSAQPRLLQPNSAQTDSLRGLLGAGLREWLLANPDSWLYVDGEWLAIVAYGPLEPTRVQALFVAAEVCASASVSAESVAA